MKTGFRFFLVAGIAGCLMIGSAFGEPAKKAPPMPPAYHESVPPPTMTGVKYGEHERHVLDFWQAESDKPAPMLFVIHGGGWSGGSKERLDRFADAAALLKAGISVVAINYRLMKHSQGVVPPVKAPLHDAARALQFVRSKAAEWNIDKERIGAAGGSAGACSSLWLAFHDDLADPKSDDPVARESTRLWCAAVKGPQTTLDPKQMKEWTPNSKYGGHAFGKKNFAQFLAERESILPWIAEYSPYALVSAGDPPVYMIFGSPPAIGKPQKDPTHTSNFGLKLQEHCKEFGVKCSLVYPGAPDVKYESPTAYLIATLKGAGRKMTENKWLIGVVAIASMLLFVVTLIVLPIIIIRMPVDYFQHRKRQRSPWRECHPVIFTLTMLLCITASVNAADGINAEKLSAMAPRVSLDEEGVTSFEVSGILNHGGFNFRFSIFGKEPGQIAIRIVDPLDGTPILVGAGGHTMLYSPVSSEVLVGAMASAFKISIKNPVIGSGELKPEDQTLEFYFSFHAPKGKDELSDEDKEQRETLIDIHSLNSCLKRPLKLESLEGGGYMLSGHTARGNRGEMFVSLTRKEGPYSCVKLYASGKETPVLLLDEIKVNHSIPDDRFVFPMQEIIDSGLSVRNGLNDGIVQKLVTMHKLAQTLLVRFVLSGKEDNPDLKKAAQEISLQSLDWDKIRKNDKQAGAVLRTLFEVKEDSRE